MASRNLYLEYSCDAFLCHMLVSESLSAGSQPPVVPELSRSQILSSKWGGMAAIACICCRDVMGPRDIGPSANGSRKVYSVCGARACYRCYRSFSWFQACVTHKDHMIRMRMGLPHQIGLQDWILSTEDLTLDPRLSETAGAE